MKKFSVVIPAYNCEKFIKDSMESVLRQTYEDIELIVINDGSTDDTERVVLETAAAYPQRTVIYRRIENSGPSTARNYGIEVASGDYICFLDSDDKYKETLFADIAKKEEPFDICFFGWADNYEDSDEVFSKYTDRFNYLTETVTGVEAVKLQFQKYIWLCTCNEVYSLPMIKEKGLHYPKGVYAGEDLHFIYTCLLNARRVVSLNENYYFYTYRENSLMHATFSEKYLTEFEAWRTLCEYATVENVDRDIQEMFFSLYYYSRIAVAKKLAKSLKWYQGFRFAKLYKKYIPKLKKTEKVIFTRLQKTENAVLKTSKLIFFVMCKIVYRIKDGRRHASKN